MRMKEGGAWYCYVTSSTPKEVPLLAEDFSNKLSFLNRENSYVKKH